MQSARDNSLLQEGEVADFSEADRDAMEARDDFCRMSGEVTCPYHVMLREQVYVPKESSFPIPSKYVDVVRQTTTDLENLQESSIDDLWSI